MTPQAGYMATRSPNTRAYVILANFTYQKLAVRKSTALGIAEEALELLIDKINQRQ